MISHNFCLIVYIKYMSLSFKVDKVIYAHDILDILNRKVIFVMLTIRYHLITQHNLPL